MPESEDNQCEKVRLLSTHYCEMVITRVWSQVAGNPRPSAARCPHNIPG